MGRRLERENAVLIVIDVQEKLARVIDQIEETTANIERLIRGCSILGVPTVMTEQYPQGIGPTVEPLISAHRESGGETPIVKACFSSHGCEEFSTKLRELSRKQVILCGIEAHVCVYQTALDLLDDHFEVHLVADAISSRSSRNREIAIDRLASEGAKLTSTEMALFEMTEESGTDEFRAISKLIK